MSTHLRNLIIQTIEIDCSSYQIILLVRENPKTPKTKKENENMENRVRKNQVKVYLSDEEKELFENKRRLSKCRNMSIFLRKCVAEKAIYYVDLKPFNEIQGQLARVTGSLNQIAKRVNQTGVIYRDDIQSMKDQIDNLSREIFDIHSLLLERTKKL